MRKKINIDGKTYFLDTDIDKMVYGELKPFWNSHHYMVIKGNFRITYNHVYNNDARSDYNQIENIDIKKIEKPHKNTILEKLGSFKSVVNMKSNNNNSIPNQFILYFANGEIFQSYNSIIIIKLYDVDTYYLGEDYKYSKTTAKYRNLFLKKDTKEIEEDIKNKKAFVIEDL